VPYCQVFCFKKQESLSSDGIDKIEAESSKLKGSFSPLSAFSFELSAKGRTWVAGRPALVGKWALFPFL